MKTLDPILDAAVADNAVPFIVAMTGNAAGMTWSGAAGESQPGKTADEDTVFRIFSMTKAVGSAAAMQLIDKGKLDIDAPVESVLPDFAKIQVLDGFDGDEPKLRAPKSKATIRQLATHTAGFAYEFWNPDIPKYMELTEHPTILSGLKSSLYYPLTFDPGERWDYGIGIDWLGQVVEAVDGRRIDQYCQDEIFSPLGMANTAFEANDSLSENLAVVSIRGEDGEFSEFELAPPPQPEFYGMGHALYSTAPDYLTFIRSFLNRGQIGGNRILSERAVNRMLENNIGDIRVGRMQSVAPPLTADVDVFPNTEKTHGFGFLRVEADVPGMRSAGSLGWAGVCNTHYWFDPQRDVAAVLMTQSLPFVEQPYMDLYERFERAVYTCLPS